MTNIELYYNDDNKIGKVLVSGHAGFKDSDDIVCASISAITQTALLGLIKVACIDVDYEVEDGYLCFSIPNNLSEDDQTKVDAIVQTMKEGLLDIQSGYKKFVKLEEIYNVY